MYVQHHTTSFISSQLHRNRLRNFFPFFCPFPMWDVLWDGPCWVSSFRLPFSSVLSEDLCSFLFPVCVLKFCFLIIIAVPRVARDVFCPLQYSDACSSKAAWIRGSPLLRFHGLRFLTLLHRCICGGGYYLSHAHWALIIIIIIIIIQFVFLLVITFSWATSKSSLGPWSIANDEKNWTVMRKWIRCTVIGHEYNRGMLPAI